MSEPLGLFPLPLVLVPTERIPLHIFEDRYRELIGEAFGSHPQITFAVDPALIAGLELHGPHFSIGNSWRADLDAIRADIGHAPRA